MLDPFNLRGERDHREMNKNDHNTAITKTSLQEYNDPRLDHPCLSALNKFYRQNEKKEVEFY